MDVSVLLYYFAVIGTVFLDAVYVFVDVFVVVNLSVAFALDFSYDASSNFFNVRCCWRPLPSLLPVTEE